MESLIEKVKQYPCLWNMNDIYYRDTGKKDAAWDRIAKQCGLVNGREAKNQWKKLRDSHREALRRRKTATVQILRPWKYEAQMEFVLQQSEYTETVSSLPTLQDSHHDTQNSSDIESTPSPPGSPHPSSSYIDHENRKQKILEMSSFDMNRVPQDALSNLFASLYQKTRELPKYLQLRVQREIFESVTRAEEEAMSLDPLNSYYSPVARNSSALQSSPFSDASADTKPKPPYGK
ncbi:uncharacterized protein LOC123866664 [Maniola jurtina]|uniref:uncharacterized protein LOC123866664 n=1 Tax=Maniola jurtina TaxID=191418 RepID=UPI001E68F7E5|nr:uncharacterized protein LOC123866664 [Maniola jurtina]